MNKVKDYYGGMQVYGLEIHQSLNAANIKTIKKLINKAEFEKDYQKRITLEYIEQLENNAETMDKIIRDYEDQLREFKKRR